MPEFSKFSPHAKHVLVNAQKEARRLKHDYIGTEHLLLGLIDEKGSLAAQVLREIGIEKKLVATAIEQHVGRGPFSSGRCLHVAPRAKQMFEFAFDEARHKKQDCVGTEHLLLGMIRVRESLASHILQDLGINLGQIRQLIDTHMR